MNQDGEENEIRRLFRELRREDERLAPSFAEDWGAALSQIDKGRRARLMFRRPITAAAALALLGSFAFLILRRPLVQPTPTATSVSFATIAQPPPSAPTSDVSPLIRS